MERTKTNHEPAFFNIHDVARRYNVTRATVWAWMSQGKFPQPLRFTPGCSRWSLDDLKAWEQEKRSERCSRHEWEELQRKQQRSKEKELS